MQWWNEERVRPKQFNKGNVRSTCNGGKIKWAELFLADTPIDLYGSLRKQDFAQNIIKLVVRKP